MTPAISPPEPHLVDEEAAAAAAWIEFAGGSPPTSAQKLTTQRKRRAVQSVVFRLGWGSERPTVIAKHGALEKIELEHRIMRHILPRYQVLGPQCYGMTADVSRRTGWIFIEDGGDVAYRESDDAHRDTATLWLAALHNIDPSDPLLAAIPRRTDRDFLEKHVRVGRNDLLSGSRNPALTPEQRRSVSRIVELFDEIERAWPAIQSAWSGLGPSLVHGDFIEKNIRVSGSSGSPRIFAFDWEFAGISSPIEDMGELNPSLYRNAARGTPSRPSLALIEHSVRLGTMLRSVAWIQATAAGLVQPWVDEPIEALRWLHDDLVRAGSEAGIWQP
jgi:aminoglycoside phosphotransferase (APT) family kinase protein